uniref:Coronin n=1 Tax=Capra hircus TaxID=9925 RepID=A0A8C2SHH0_CAPHI
MSFCLYLSYSKFRHIFGKPASENCYDSVPITHSVPDSHFCAVNPNFTAVVTESTGGGAFLVIPLHQTGKLDPHYLKVCGHRGNVLDVRWNPFNDFEIASCSEDATIKIWGIPKQLLTKNLTAFRKELWHPTAANILFSSSYDYKVMVWNLNLKKSVIMSPMKTINCHQDVILSMSFNTDGSLLATACKDRHPANKVLFLGNLKKLLSTAHPEGTTSRWPDGTRTTSLCAWHRGGPQRLPGHAISANKPHLNYPMKYCSITHRRGSGLCQRQVSTCPPVRSSVSTS